jgi:hypothetical protein
VHNAATLRESSSASTVAPCCALLHRESSTSEINALFYALCCDGMLNTPWKCHVARCPLVHQGLALQALASLVQLPMIEHFSERAYHARPVVSAGRRSARSLEALCSCKKQFELSCSLLCERSVYEWSSSAAYEWASSAACEEYSTTRWWHSC